MAKPYRVYLTKENHPTFFLNEGEGEFLCTHGAWTGTHVEPATLKHVFGEAVYDRYEDLTKDEYKKRMFKEYL